VTPIPTDSPTPTPTDEPTDTPTPIPSDTPTPTEAPTATPTPRDTPTPTPVQKNIVDAFEDGDIDITYGGGNLWEDRFWIYNKKDYPIWIWIPYGVYFESGDPKFQNLMPTEQYLFEIPANGSGYIDLSVVCMNFTLTTPPSSSSMQFVPKRIATNDVMYYVGYCITNVYKLEYEAIQAVTWYFTDPGLFGMASVYNYLSDLPESYTDDAVAAIKWVEAYIKNH
jgi:hypothetical protein